MLEKSLFQSVEKTATEEMSSCIFFDLLQCQQQRDFFSLQISANGEMQPLQVLPLAQAPGATLQTTGNQPVILQGAQQVIQTVDGQGLIYQPVQVSKGVIWVEL